MEGTIQRYTPGIRWEDKTPTMVEKKTGEYVKVNDVVAMLESDQKRYEQMSREYKVLLDQFNALKEKTVG